MEGGIKVTNEEKEVKWTEYKDQLAFTIQINDDKKDASCKLIYYLFNQLAKHQKSAVVRKEIKQLITWITTIFMIPNVHISINNSLQANVNNENLFKNNYVIAFVKAGDAKYVMFNYQTNKVVSLSLLKEDVHTIYLKFKKTFNANSCLKSTFLKQYLAYSKANNCLIDLMNLKKYFEEYLYNQALLYLQHLFMEELDLSNL